MRLEEGIANKDELKAVVNIAFLTWHSKLERINRDSIQKREDSYTKIPLKLCQLRSLPKKSRGYFIQTIRFG